MLLLFEGEFDISYLIGRRKLDRMYNALGISAPSLFASAYVLGTILEDHLMHRLELAAPPASVRKILMFDLQLLFESRTSAGLVASSFEKTEEKGSVVEGHVVSIERLVYTDDLTGLRNRRSFVADAQSLLHTERPNAWLCRLVFIDLDNFKTINDSFGHCEGDNLLKEFSDLLSEKVGKHGAAYGYGGDEFCVLLPGCCAVDAEKFCDELAQASANLLSKPLSFSAGIVAGRPGHLGDVVDLVAKADRAMYQDKRK